MSKLTGGQVRLLLKSFVHCSLFLGVADQHKYVVGKPWDFMSVTCVNVRKPAAAQIGRKVVT